MKIYRISSAVLAALADGRQRSVKQMLPYLLKRIDPKAAVRSYVMHRRGEQLNDQLPSLEKQIEIGALFMIANALKNQEGLKHDDSNGYIVVERPEGHYEGLQVEHMKAQLTPLGMNLIWNTPEELTKGQRGRQTEVWKELFFARSRGWLQLELELSITAKKDTAPVEKRNGQSSEAEESSHDDSGVPLEELTRG